MFKKKGEVVDLFDEFTAKVKVINSNMVIKIDQVVLWEAGEA